MGLVGTELEQKPPEAPPTETHQPEALALRMAAVPERPEPVDLLSM